MCVGLLAAIPEPGCRDFLGNLGDTLCWAGLPADDDESVLFRESDILVTGV